jgi:hypothetical protein
MSMDTTTSYRDGKATANRDRNERKAIWEWRQQEAVFFAAADYAPTAGRGR